MSVGSAGPGASPAGAGGHLRIDLLGPLRARRQGAPLAVGPVRRQAVLAALVLRTPALVTYRQLLDDVWGSEPPGTGHRVLPSYVYPLRKALDEPGTGPARSVIHGGHGGYRFVPGGARTDLDELAEHLGRARDANAVGDLDAVLDHGSRALDLFRGEPLTGLPGPLADAERRRLLRQQRDLHQERVQCLVLLGRHADALDELMTAPLAQPHDEPLAALRMRALYGSGRQAEALTAYQEIRDRLLGELGVEPGEALRRTHQAVLRRDDALLLGRVPRQPAGGRSAPRGEQPNREHPDREHPNGEHPNGEHPSREHPNRTRRHGDRPPPRNELPGDTALLVGRQRELARLTAPVPPGSVSVAAIDGTAGVGKTALVVRAAWTLLDRYPDGCLYVDLHAHGAAHESVGPQRALHRLLRAVRGPAEPPEAAPHDLADLVTAWRAATSSLRLLLVVDDARSAEQVRPLLPAGPGSRVLVAGRQRLSGLDADVRLTVEPLAADDAVGLLHELLGGARAEREPEATRELARRCAGLPLALRIAGARLQNRPSWTLAHLAGRLSDDTRGLGELKAGDRSVEAAFGLSYDQLAPGLQRGFRAVGLAPTARFDALALAAMLGGSREDAEEVLEELVDASLLQQPEPDRYRLHDLVRAHARRLAAAVPEEAAADRAAVLRLYTAAGRIAADWGPEAFPTGPDITGPPFPGRREAVAWLDGAGGELVDVVAYAAATGHYDHACWIAEALADHLVRQGHHHECRAALEIALRCADLASDQRMPSSLRNCMGIVDVHQGRFRQAHTWFTEALRHAHGQDHQRERARSIAGMGVSRWPQGHVDEAVGHLSTAVELAERLGDDWLAGIVNCNLGAIHTRQGRHEQALERYSTALALAEKNGRPRILGETLCFVADAHLALGRPDEATPLLWRAADLAHEVADLPLRAMILSRLGAAEQGRGNLRSAVDLHREALSTLTEHTSTWLEMDVRIRLGRSYAAAGRRGEAREEFRTALSLSGAADQPGAYDSALDGLRNC